MTVGRRLAIAFGIQLALLVVVLIYHVRTIHGAVRTANDLSDLSARIVLVSSRQGIRLGQIEENAEKYVITRDVGYREKFQQLVTEFAVDLEQLEALETADAERAPLDAVQQRWRDVRPRAALLAAATTVPPIELARLRAGIAELRTALDVVSDAARLSMRERLAASVAAADTATQISLLAAIMALLLSIGTAVVLVRSVADPLERLILGTREVARGRFGHRLDTDRGDEFAQVADAFNTMTERLGALDRMKQDFVTTVSHDLKSPLASLRESTTLLLDEVAGPLTDAQRRVLVLQQESGDRLSRMIAKLLELSRLEHGLPMSRRAIAVAPFLGRVAQHAATAARERDVRVELVSDVSSDLEMMADEDALRALLDNLIENAIKFSPRNEVVTLSAAADATGVRFAVEDAGPGVAEADRERIFERFQQTSVGRNVPARGVGLGLTICREIARAHAGRVAVESRDGGGSRFVVTIPLGTASAESAAHPGLVEVAA